MSYYPPQSSYPLYPPPQERASPHPPPYFAGPPPPQNPYPPYQQGLPPGQSHPAYSPYGAPSPYQQPSPHQHVSPYLPPPQQYHQPGPITFHFCDGGKHSMILTSPDRNHVLLTANYNHHSFSSQPDIVIMRGQSSIPVGSVNFHTWTSRIDLQINGRSFTYKDDFDSNTGLGRLYWKYQNKRQDGHLKVEDRSGQVIAAFTFFGWNIAEVGQIEVFRHGLSPAQMDEILVSAIAEIKSMERDNEQGPNAGVVAGLAAASS